MRSLAYLAIALAFAGVVRAQPGPAPTLDDIIASAEKGNTAYTERFNNLSAEENKVFDDYDREGKVSGSRQIRSIFIVYQSPRDSSVGELRNVVEYNGKPVVRKDDEILRFLDKVASSGSLQKEFNNLRDDGIRFDGRSAAWGMTLWQESPFGGLRPFMEYKLVEIREVEGRRTAVIDYNQIKPTLLIKYNPVEDDWKKEPNGRVYSGEISRSLKPYQPYITGRIMIDIETGQTRLNEFKLMAHPPSLTKPLEALALSYEYRPSEFGIFLPKHFVIQINKIKGTKAVEIEVLRDRIMTFDYSNFSEFRAESKGYKIGRDN